MSWYKPKPDGTLYILISINKNNLNNYQFQDREHAIEWMKDGLENRWEEYFVRRCEQKKFTCNCPNCHTTHINPGKIIEEYHNAEEMRKVK